MLAAVADWEPDMATSRSFRNDPCEQCSRDGCTTSLLTGIVVHAPRVHMPRPPGTTPLQPLPLPLSGADTDAEEPTGGRHVCRPYTNPMNPL